MNNLYSVYYGKEKVGQAEIAQMGLYYCVQCRCRLEKDALFRVIAKCEGMCCRLGILVPVGSYFELSARVAVKNIDLETLCIYIEPVRQSSGRVLVPIHTNGTIPCLATLEDMRICENDGIRYLALVDEDINQS